MQAHRIFKNGKEQIEYYALLHGLQQHGITEIKYRETGATIYRAASHPHEGAAIEQTVGRHFLNVINHTVKGNCSVRCEVIHYSGGSIAVNVTATIQPE